MKILYGDIACDGIKSHNYKRLHSIPMHTKPRTKDGAIIYCLNIDQYLSKRSKKKRKKAHFRHSFNPLTESVLKGNPRAARLWHRYGYMKKILRRKAKCLGIKLLFHNGNLIAVSQADNESR